MMQRTPKDNEFDRRIHQLYSRHIADGHLPSSGQEATAMREMEIRAMAEAFLGTGYDEKKIARVVASQRRLQARQDWLDGSYEAGRIGKHGYMALLSSALRDTFSQCEEILGRKDFEILFGCSPEQAPQFIDPEQFLRARSSE